MDCSGALRTTATRGEEKPVLRYHECRKCGLRAKSIEIERPGVEL